MTSFVIQAVPNESITSFFLDPILFSFAGITITNEIGVLDGNIANGDGFQITEASDFSFELDDADATNLITSVNGRIEHLGSITLTASIDTEIQAEIGNFSIGFDPERENAIPNASGFFVVDTITTNEPLFDIGNLDSVTIDNGILQIADADLLLSPELADFVVSLGIANPGTLTPFIGLDVGDLQIDTAIIESLPPDPNPAPPTDNPDDLVQEPPVEVADPVDLNVDGSSNIEPAVDILNIFRVLAGAPQAVVVPDGVTVSQQQIVDAVNDLANTLDVDNSGSLEPAVDILNIFRVLAGAPQAVVVPDGVTVSQQQIVDAVNALVA